MKSFDKRFKLLPVAGLAIAGLAVSGCTQKAAGPPPGGLVEVSVSTVAPQRAVLTTELPGRTSAYLVAEIRPQVNGLIQKRLFEEGAFVQAGQLLYQIDPAPYEAAYAQAKAALTTAEAELVTAEANLPAIRLREGRLKNLVATNAVARQDHDDASAALKQAEANLNARKAAVEISRAAVESARINLSYTPIRAPISGRIGISNVTVGALATAYQPAPFAVIQQIDPIYVDVAQANAELLDLRKRMEQGVLKRNRSTQSKVRLLLEDGTTYVHQGALKFQDVTVDPTTGTVTLRMVFPNPHQVLLPGTFVRAVVEEGVSNEALLVPQQGITRNRKGIPVALVVNAQNRVEERLLDLDRAIGDTWLVTKGLVAGDRVIVEGLQKVRPGSEVRPVPFLPSGGVIQSTAQSNSKDGGK